MEAKDRKPFHESVVETMDKLLQDDGWRNHPTFMVRVAFVVKDFLCTTYIPANHDAIIVSWKRLAEAAVLGTNFSNDVVNQLLDQKRIAEEKNAAAEGADPARGSGLLLGYGEEHNGGNLFETPPDRYGRSSDDRGSSD